MGHKVGVWMAVHDGDDAELFRRAVLSICEQKLLGDVQVRIYLGVDGPIAPAASRTVHDLTPQLYKVFWFPKNRGLVAVLNDLIAAREDEAFYFRMDADDYSMPDRFQRQLDYMLRNPAVHILGTDMVEFDVITNKRRIVHFADSPEQARSRISRGVPVAHPTVCFRANVFDFVPHYPLVRLNEDIEMWFACLRAGLRFDNVPEPLYEFRIGPQFWRRRGWEKTWSEFKAYVHGIWELDGITWRYAFPLARLLLRLAPTRIKRFAYASKLRKSSVLDNNQS